MEANPWATTRAQPAASARHTIATPSYDAAAFSAESYRSQQQPAYAETTPRHINGAARPASLGVRFAPAATPAYGQASPAVGTATTSGPAPISAAGPSFAAPRSSTRAQLLSAAASLGLHGWDAGVPAVPSDSGDESRFRGALPAQFDAGSAQNMADHTTWLAHATHLRRLLEKENEANEAVWRLDGDISAHEREQDVREVMATEAMETHSAAVWEWAQHLAAVMSANADAPVHHRNPQPSQWQNIARSAEVGSPSSAHRQFTHAPVAVHPSLRSLLQPPIARNTFIHVEPELQPGLLSGVESMCRDVAQWKAPRARPNDDPAANTPDTHTSPPDALIWTSTLQSQQQPLADVLHSVVGNWSRLQRVADSLSSGHAITRELHDRERTAERRTAEIRQEDQGKGDRGHFKPRAY